MKSQKEKSKKPQQRSFEASAKSAELLLIEQKVAKCTAKDASKMSLAKKLGVLILTLKQVGRLS